MDEILTLRKVTAFAWTAYDDNGNPLVTILPEAALEAWDSLHTTYAHQSTVDALIDRRGSVR